MIGCPEVRDLLVPFLDGELEVEKNVQVLKHLELCPPCRHRSEEEGQLRGLVHRCAEPLDQATRARILAGAFARVGAEQRATRRRRTGLALLAAAALLVVGAGALLGGDLLCLRGCPTDALLLQAREAMHGEPLPLEVVEREFKRRITVPTLVSTHLLGGDVLRSCSGCPCQPMLRFGCEEGGQLAFFVIPRGHTHVGRRQALPDGREYVVVQREGLRTVGWVRPDGTLAVCMPCNRVGEEQLFVLAAALRDAAG